MEESVAFILLYGNSDKKYISHEQLFMMQNQYAIFRFDKQASATAFLCFCIQNEVAEKYDSRAASDEKA
jgi:hypothetical protein